MVNCSVWGAFGFAAENQHRSKNRTSEEPTWSKVVGSWCHCESSSGVSTGFPSGGPRERVSGGSLCHQPLAGQVGVRIVPDEADRRFEQRPHGLVMVGEC